MQQGAGERQQILHYRALTELVDIHRTEAQAGLLEARHDREQVGTRTHQDCNGVLRVPLAGFLDDRNYPPRFGLVVAVKKRMNCDGWPLAPPMKGH